MYSVGIELVIPAVREHNFTERDTSKTSFGLDLFKRLLILYYISPLDTEFTYFYPRLRWKKNPT